MIPPDHPHHNEYLDQDSSEEYQPPEVKFTNMSDK